MKNKKYFALVALVCIPFLFTSCAAMTRYKCNRDYAAKKGMEDANAGLSSQPNKTEGEVCKEAYTASNFAHDYLQGFAQKKAEVCQKSMGAAFGTADGSAGLAQKPQLQKLNLCSDVKSFNAIVAEYNSAFNKSFCATDRAAKLGAAHGAAVEAEAFDSNFVSCKQQNSLRAAYTGAYKNALASFCTEAQAQNLGNSLAAQKRPHDEGYAKFSRCTGANGDAIRTAFTTSFQDTKTRLEREEAARVAAAQEQARQTRMAEFQRNTAVSVFSFQARPHTSRCAIAADKSFVQVEVENPYPDQVLIQGSWKVLYFNNDFAKITEDSTQEAVLVTGNNKKTFQKLTLPRDAAFCRAEYTGAPRPTL